MKQPQTKQNHSVRTITTVVLSALVAICSNANTANADKTTYFSSVASNENTESRGPHSGYREISFSRQAASANIQLGLRASENSFFLAGPQNAKKLLSRFNPALSLGNCKIVLSSRKQTKNRTSEYFKIECAGYPVENAELNIHSNDNSVLLVNGIVLDERIEFSISKIQLDAITSFDHRTKLTEYSHIKEKHLGLCAPTLDEKSNNANLFPCWVMYANHLETEIQHLIRANAWTGELHSVIPQDFSLSTVYQEGPQDAQTIETELPELDDSGYLNGKNFEVYAPFEGDDRVYSLEANFQYSPATEVLKFDQVQAYYGATKTLNWFRENFGYDLGEETIKVRVHANIGGSMNNARYQPDEGSGPEILLGTGDGETLENISRDTDVIAHEFSHHIIYQRLKSSRGEPGLIHESFSDYFAYAMNEDPRLAETIKIGSQWLRTAKISTEFRFDDPNLGWKPHEKAQIISAVLWNVREIIGVDMDQIVYSSIDYLKAESGLKDAFLGLLNADRDHFPLEPDNPEAKTFGIHKCEIIEAAVNRGFSRYLGDLDGESCKLDLANLAEESREFTEQKRLDEEAKNKGRAGNFKVFGRPCAVINSSERYSFLLLIFMLVPALVALCRRQNRIPNTEGRV